MKMANNATEGLPSRNAKSGAYSVTAILLLGLSIIALTSIASPGKAAGLNLVDVTIQTTQSYPYQYTLTVYNTTGNQVANFYGNFPEAAFALPAGTYLITASAYYQQSYYCNVCIYAKSPANANGSAIAMPIRYIPPSSEYGFAVEQVTGPVQVTIATKNSTAGPVVKVPVHVRFANGTAAAGAWVYASVIGSNYGWSPAWNMSGSTGPDGNVTLLLPEGPVQISASLSVPIQLPKNISTVTVIVGGQKVNVTVYWQPNTVSLSGQTLVLPPQESASITLQVQQNYPYPIPLYGAGVAQPGVTSSGTGVYSITTTYASTTMGGNAAAIRQSAGSPQANRIAPFNPSSAQLSPPGKQAQLPATTPFDFATVEALVAVVAAAAVIGVGVSLALSRRKPAVDSARLF